jgi:hypothetical protein
MIHRQALSIVVVITCASLMMQRASHDRLSAPGTEVFFKVCLSPPLSKMLMHSLLHARAWETNRRRDHPDNFITTVWDQGTMGKRGLHSETAKGK